MPYAYEEELDPKGLVAYDCPDELCEGSNGF